MSSSSLLVAQSLTRMVDGTRLVDDVSFEVQRGEVFVVFGPSGAGKTSLLRLLNRLDEPTSGTVMLDGVEYGQLSPQTLRKRVGLVPQQPTLMDGTVAENVAWGPVLRNEPVDEKRRAQLLDRLGLGGFGDRAAGQLSGGEARRVALARTLFNEPEIVLLDEPTANLDDEAARRVERLLRDVIADLSLTAVLVTHAADQAGRLGTRGLRLEGGRIQRTGSVDRIVSS